ncbi:MAG: hypothetical protein A7315_05990 [Candidatus Altiarchaeales archaeon WOR_SM1_79]|nr:MAG: hypothetical protein A7315_05990 [Candidatus Altiarchaeales archaeon WOR_SM1_79]
MNDDIKILLALLGLGGLAYYLGQRKPPPGPSIGGVITNFEVIEVPEGLRVRIVARNTGSVAHDFGFGVSFKKLVGDVWVDWFWSHMTLQPGEEKVVHDLKTIDRLQLYSLGLLSGNIVTPMARMWGSYDPGEPLVSYYFKNGTGRLYDLIDEKWSDTITIV